MNLNKCLNEKTRFYEARTQSFMEPSNTSIMGRVGSIHMFIISSEGYYYMIRFETTTQ